MSKGKRKWRPIVFEDKRKSRIVSEDIRKSRTINNI